MEPGVLRSSRAGDDSGFTLVEAIVALGVLATIMTALAYAMIGSLTASRASRVEQQAIDFATQRLEQVRQMDFGSIGHDLADVENDIPWVSSCVESDTCVDPGTGAEEPLVIGGQIVEHLQTVEATVANNTTFTLRTFVTDPGDQYDATYKRVTVVASWMAGSNPRQRSISSFVASTTRGLPLPLFKLTPVGSTSAVLNPGDGILYRFELTNQGAPDKWNLTVSDPTGWALYADDGDGDWEFGTDPQVVDTSLDGIPDTGLVDPTATYTFWAYRAGASNTQIGPVNARFTAVSVMQPQAASGTAYIDTAAQIVEGVVIVTNPPTPPPSSGLATPTGLSAAVSGTTVTLAWGAVDSANGYEIYLGGELVASTSTSPWTSSWSVGTYSVQVRATKGTDESALSSPITVQVAEAPVTSSTAVVGLPMVMAVDGPAMTISPLPAPLADCAAPVDSPGSGTGTYTEYALHNGTPSSPQTVSAMPRYSVDIADVGGRVVQRGGTFLETDTKKVVDWRTNVDRRSYSGSAILRLWVAPLPTVDLSEVALKAQLFKWKSPPGVRTAISGSAASLPEDTSYTCAGWQEVKWSLPLVGTAKMGKNEYLGVRVWNEGVQDLRIAYDIKDLYPSSLTIWQAE